MDTRTALKAPFDLPTTLAKRHYRAFGVETSGRALLHPRILWSGLRWILASRRFYNKAENDILGLPADFLIDAQGKVVSCKYGTHADDQWDVDELLRQAAPCPDNLVSPPFAPFAEKHR